MPLFLAALFLLGLKENSIFIDLLGLLGRNYTDLVVLASKFTTGVRDRMDVKLRGSWLARQFPEALDKLFLQLICDVILLAKEYNPTSRY